MVAGSGLRPGAAAALAFGFSGAVAAAFVFSDGFQRMDDAIWPMAAIASVAAALVAAVLWPFFVGPHGSKAAGGIVGAFIGALAHLPLWMLITLHSNMFSWSDFQWSDLPLLLLGSVGWGIYSILLFGIVTIPLGLVTGILLAHLRRRPAVRVTPSGPAPLG